MTLKQKIILRNRSFKIHISVLGGFWQANKYFFRKHILRKKELTITIKGEKNPIYLRNFTSDIGIFAQIFINKEFEIGIQNLIAPKVIVDCGANIGLATLYFKYTYPNAVIYCFEPEPSNFQLLQKNVAQCSNIKTYEKAVWNETEMLQLNLDSRHDSFFITKNSNDKSIGVQAISLNDFLNESKINKIDLLKIDIEGAELDLFSKNLDWIDKTNVIIVEIHERAIPGLTEHINNLLIKDFHLSYTGEYIKYTRKN